MSLPNELPEIELAHVAHVGRTRVPEVRVMSPDHRARVAGGLAHMSQERLEGFHHVRVAKVPRLHAPTEHRAIVPLGIAYQSRVLLRKEVLVGGDPAVAARVRGRPKLHELLDYIVLARAR